MADDRLNRLHRITIPIPNPALAEWLVGPECKRAVIRYTEAIAAEHSRLVPVVTGRLRGGIDTYYAISGWGVSQDRWFGWVTNPVEYAAIHEWGKKTGPPSKHRRGYHELKRAMHNVAGRPMPGVTDLRVPGLGERPDIPRRASGRIRPQSFTPRAKFDASVGRYRDARGRFVKKPT